MNNDEPVDIEDRKCLQLWKNIETISIAEKNILFTKVQIFVLEALLVNDAWAVF